MRAIYLTGLGSLVFGGSAFAQIDFSAKLPNNEALLCEPIPIVVTIQNNRVDALPAGSEQGYSIAFELTDQPGLLVRPIANAVVQMPAVIKGQSTVVFTNDLQSIFPVGKYAALAVRARLTVGSRSFVTDKMYVDILPGAEIARLQAPTPDGEVHTYSLRSISREKRDRLFLRVANEDESLCYAAIELGRFMRIGKPTLEVDGLGRVHVLHLSGPNRFVHSVFEANGAPVSRDLIEGDLSLVRLVEDGQGSFRVAGGGLVSPPRDPVVDALPVRRGL